MRKITLAILALATLSMFAANMHVATPSRWKLDTAQSDFGTGPKYMADEFTVTVDTDKWLKFTGTTTMEDGKPTKVSYDAPHDGTMKPVKGMPGMMMGAKSSDDSSHSVAADGTVEDSTLTLSEDKKTLTFHVMGKKKDGTTYTQTLVYQRTM